MIMSGASGWALAKGAVLTACMAGIWQTYRTMPVPALAAKMMRVYKAGEIFLTKKGQKGKEVKIYPKHKVIIGQDLFKVIITLPLGMDPGLITKREWTFRQAFGEQLELTGGPRTFTLIVSAEAVRSFKYNYETIAPHLKDRRLPIVVGRSRSGFEVYDMVDHPHLLIAGETGSGKSVALRSILSTIILSRPDVDLYCADLKRSEFHLFRGLAKKVVVDPSKLQAMLKQLQQELRRRGDLLDESEVAHIDDLEDPPPYIVLAIDEVALLKKEKESMAIVEEISAIGRALGVFLILSMQRPDADVLDGKLKNNLTVRMAFRHADEINSRITIGSGEAAKIKEGDKGRMILKMSGLKEVQAPYLELDKAKKLLAPHKRLTVVEKPTEEDLLGVLEL